MIKTSRGARSDLDKYQCLHSGGRAIINCFASPGLQLDGVITSAAWSVEGLSLALGLEDGRISLRGASGTELSILLADSHSPVVAIGYAPAR